MKSEFDVVVVGGGPAGSWAARHAAEKGASVALFEKDREIGLPVRCAEGVSAEGLERLVPVRPAWIARSVRGARLVAPDGTGVVSQPGETGYVLNRKHFDADLASFAADAGAEVLTKAYVSGLLVEEGRVRGVHLEHLGERTTVRCSVVIGADGVESRVGRWAGLDTATPPEEIASCAQATLAGLRRDPDTAEFHFGTSVAPGGYAWVFPKGERSANVGLGIPASAARLRKPIDRLQDFTERLFPGASVLTLVAGGVPLCPPPDDIVTDGVMLAGDAAHQANPITGGGILNALVAGKLAGETAAEAAAEGDTSRRRLAAYQKAWMHAGGKAIERQYRLKRAMFSLDDSELNRIARTLLDIPPEERTAFQIFKAGLFKHPRLLLELAKAMV
jgi:digeranylgeranylglycerophospholipid reductase